METRVYRSAGWAALLSGLTAILATVSLILFFAIEAPQGATSGGQAEHLWGPLSDISPILQMLLLLPVMQALYRMERSRAGRSSLMAALAGVLGAFGVAAFQLLLITRVLAFEQEVGLVVLATGVVGAWLVLANHLGRIQGLLPARLAWLGMAVGVAFVMEPVLLSALGGASFWRNLMSNYVLLAGAALVFLVAYVGFPIWAIWLGRALLAPAAAADAAARIRTTS